jgi:hypothetical protein
MSGVSPCVYKQADMLFVVAFKVYDMDRDGYISNGELYLVLKMMVGNNLKVGLGTLCAAWAHRPRTGPATTANSRQDDNGGGSGWVS